MDAEQIVGEWPDIMVDILKSDVELAHSINPRSWSIFSHGSNPVFGVSRTSNLLFYPGTGRAFIQISLRHANNETKQWLRDQGNTFEDNQPGLDVELPYSALNELPDDLIAAHHHHIRYHARHRNNRWKSFREDFHQAFSDRLEEPLPLPGYYEQLIQLRNTEANKDGPEQRYDSTKVEPTGYWMITSNPRSETEARDYARSLEEGQIIHRYGDLSINFGEFPSNRAQFVRRAVNLDGVAQRTGNRLWLFTYGVQEGDWIVIQSTFPAIGQFTGEYQHTEDGDTRTVDWHWVSPDPVASESFYSALNGRNLWGFTTLEPIEFKKILEALGQNHLVDLRHISEVTALTTLEDTMTPLEISPKDIGAHYASKGLHYSATQIADFYTALQTKGFVVLSGISGTGKSKIATGFTEMLPLPEQDSTSVDQDNQKSNHPDKTLIFTTSVNPSAKRSGTSILKADAHKLNFLSPGESIQVPTRLDGDEGTIKFVRRSTNKSNPGYPSMEFSKEVHNYIADWPVGTPYQVILHRGGLDTASIKRLDARATSSTPSDKSNNTLFLSVRPDWRDSTSLLGYYNPLTKTYEWTDFLRFVLDAAENFRSEDPIAWFVILDEMNLAHVEYYFADLLSVLESGRETNPNHEDFGFTDQPLRLTYPETVVNETPPTEVRLPPNLYIIGTVNMDETTHAFSPKVLDRAFTMELTEVDFSDYPFVTAVRADDTLSDESKHEFLRVFSQNGTFPQIRKDEIREFVLENENIRSSIQRLNTNLANYRFHFGYRVFDEIMQFLANAEANDMYEDPLDALDSAAFMKILPKFSGSEARVGLPLTALIEWAKDPFAKGEEARPLERTLDRAEYMQSVLQTDGFVTAF